MSWQAKIPLPQAIFNGFLLVTVKVLNSYVQIMNMEKTKTDFLLFHKKEQDMFLNQTCPVLFSTGPAGFEPSSAAVKVLCLTAWRWPNGLYNVNACLLYLIPVKKAIEKMFFPFSTGEKHLSFLLI